MTRYLAESEDYKVTADDETVTLYFKRNLSRKPIRIGYFYGDPECALISRDEKYVIVAGCGLVIYKLEEPFEDYGTADSVRQSTSLFTDPPSHWWVNGLHQTEIDADWNYFRFVAANDTGEGIYKMNATTFELEKISY